MDGYEERKAILAEIEKSQATKALLYVTGDRPGMETQVSPEVVDLFVDHLDALWPCDRLTLVLYTPGGDTAAAWRIINLLRTYCDDLCVIVSLKAHSAGTLICLGADRIMMTKQATLGPIDPSLNGPLNPQIPGGAPNQRAPVSVEAVQGYLDVVQNTLRINDPVSLAQVLNSLSEKIHPLVLGQIFRTRAQIRDLAGKLLTYQEITDDTRERIISVLCSESGSHDYTINRREAANLGLAIDKPSESFYEVLKALHQSVVDSLELRTPFSPDTVLKTDQQTSYVARRALIESTVHGSHQFVSEGVLTKLSIPNSGGAPHVGVQDDRTFEGWRKEA